MNENLVQAQHLIKEKLNEALTNALNEKYEAFAPTIFEGAKPDFLDLDKDGDTEEPMKQAARQAEGEDEDEAEDEKQSEEEEEGGSEEEEDEEDDQDSEEADEEEKD
jgi:hypothetical protein